jgi:hypothetical protein
VLILVAGAAGETTGGQAPGVVTASGLPAAANYGGGGRV